MKSTPSRADRAVRLDRRQPHVLADEAGAVDLDEVASPEEAHRPVHLREQAGDRRLASPRVAHEDEVLRGCDLREAVLLAPRLHLQERDEGVHLLLDGLEADERVELGLELLHAPGGLGLAKRLELLGDPVGAVAARPHAQTLADRFQGVVERAWHRRLFFYPQISRPVTYMIAMPAR
jgi:hypothetical protein